MRHGTIMGHTRNYLRVRGEYRFLDKGLWLITELPPRARRILSAPAHEVAAQGTTSACAENTMQCSPSPRAAWNYLRVRGEYIRKLYESRGYEELPPRARRILVLVVMILAAWGTTSACAENTSMSSKKRFPARNYLRVRGEYRIRAV